MHGMAHAMHRREHTGKAQKAGKGGSMAARQAAQSETAGHKSATKRQAWGRHRGYQHKIKRKIVRCVVGSMCHEKEWRKGRQRRQAAEYAGMAQLCFVEGRLLEQKVERQHPTMFVRVGRQGGRHGGREKRQGRWERGKRYMQW